ncbi:MAG TPA: 1,4-alpha-glucan branching protein GlgB [Thermoanaerobaculia bacterium]|nr:1,4-alpha-glucan branching protein GlgB [Thermoanaerobaculia bacterium]
MKAAPASVPAPVSKPGEAATPFLTEHDLYLFNEGTHRRLYEKLGAHPMTHDGVEGTYFAVWAPSAMSVSLIGDFNGWEPGVDYLNLRGMSGVWDGFFPGIGKGAVYKYNIVSKNRRKSFDKADPFGFAHECPPETASTVTTLDYEWGDKNWMRDRAAHHGLTAPMSTYEVHLGSWRRPENPDEHLSYRELAQPLADYVKQVGFTHVELMPVMEHPFFGSWGYQSTGYFAPSSRFGSPTDFMYLVDVLHQNGVGVLLDWVPSHFPSDAHGLAYFDGTHLFEHEDPRKGFQPDWNSLVFNYGRHEVRGFLISSAIYWLDMYHADGLRVDAVASMLYLDYSRKQGQWLPNKFGGRENLEAIDFLRQLNEAVYSELPDVLMIAEESTAWPLVSRPPYVGGLGFGMKWDMGWMHDSLKYMAQDPIHRRFHHGKLTFRPMYAYTENFVLPISHDEVVHGKGSLLRKMPGDEWQRFANLRLLLAYMWAVPGKKLLFMGCEFGQWKEWNHDSSLDWDSLQSPLHRGVQHLVGDLNRIYKETPAFYATDFDQAGFQWIDANDSDQSVISFLRIDHDGAATLCVFNFTPHPRYNYQLGVPRGGDWKEILNSDAPVYGGSGVGNFGLVEAAPLPLHSRSNSVTITLPPLGAVFLMSTAPPVGDAGIGDAKHDSGGHQ